MEKKKNSVKLLGAWPSPFALRARIALNIKSIDYDCEEAMHGLLKSDLLLKSNPVHKQVPVLIHNDNPICESLLILQYIDEFWSTAGPAILPSDPYDRATARFWAAFIDEKWVPAMRLTALAGQGEEGVEAAILQVEEGLALLEEAFVMCSGRKGFFGGDRIGYLDIALGCHLVWIRVAEEKHGVELIGAGKTPGLSKWAERFCEDVCVKDVMPEKEKLAEYAEMIAAQVRAQTQAN